MPERARYHFKNPEQVAALRIETKKGQGYKYVTCDELGSAVQFHKDKPDNEYSQPIDDPLVKEWIIAALD